MDDAIVHCTAGIGIWDWASNDDGAIASPMSSWPAAATSRRWRSLAATAILREDLPELKVRVVNVVDLMQAAVGRRASARSVRPGLRLAVHRGQADHLRLPRLPLADPPADLPAHATTSNLHVRGYKEEGTTTTPFELAINNQVDRFHLVIDVIDRVPALRASAGHVKERMKNRIIDARAYAHEHGKDRDEITGWQWPYGRQSG